MLIRRSSSLVSGATPAGSVPKIMAECLEPAKGSRVEIEDCFRAYAANCKEQKLRAVTPSQFIGPMQRFCDECGIKTQNGADRIYLLNVRLAAGCEGASAAGP